ncbi:ArnT family glycosyltransferase [Streptomyces sp. NPDC016845]|uniref:ArnT family glycosyltransferase n=1 Tax=Streptomyces sp. NPDC016845 TaxID=3364972 RepID=UPI0037B68836
MVRRGLLVGGVLGTVALTVVLRAWNLAGSPFPNDDEGTYLAQAWAVRAGTGLSHYTYWYDHPPLGWAQLAALSWFTDYLPQQSMALLQGRLAMLVVAAATALLMYSVARRLRMSRPAALSALVVNAVSPLAIDMQRQVYLDGFAVLWFLAALALALSPHRRLWAHCGSGVCFAIAVLSKETVAVLLPALLLALWQHSDRRLRVFSFTAFTAGCMVLLSYPLYSLLKGELLPGACHSSLLRALKWQLFARGGSGSVFQAGTVANELVAQWLNTDPILLAGGAVAGCAILLVRPLRPLGAVVALLVLVALRPGGYLPKMYAVQMLPFCALALAAFVEQLLKARRVRSRPGREAVRMATMTAVALALVLLGPGWRAQWNCVQTDDLMKGYRAAGHWLRDAAIHDRRAVRLVTDDVLWLDAVRAGYTPGAGAIWHYKLDKDPAVVASMPRGWLDIDYVLATPTMYEAQSELPTLRVLLRQGKTLGRFDYGQIKALRIPEKPPEGAPGPVPVPPEVRKCLEKSDDIWPYA